MCKLCIFYFMIVIGSSTAWWALTSDIKLGPCTLYALKIISCNVRHPKDVAILEQWLSSWCQWHRYHLSTFTSFYQWHIPANFFPTHILGVNFTCRDNGKLLSSELNWRSDKAIASLEPGQKCHLYLLWYLVATPQGPCKSFLQMTQKGLPFISGAMWHKNFREIWLLL